MRRDENRIMQQTDPSANTKVPPACLYGTPHETSNTPVSGSQSTMRCIVSHLISSIFSKATQIEPHTLRLRPRNSPRQQLQSFDLAIDPAPEVLSNAMDSEDNAIIHCRFVGTHQSMTIRTWAEVETCRTNAFDFTFAPGGDVLPLHLAPHEMHSLAACLQRIHPSKDKKDPVTHLALSLRKECADNSLQFCTLLNGYLFSTTNKIHGDATSTRAPEQTLKQLAGSSSDLAGLFIEVCREAGLPARFVNGYHAPYFSEHAEVTAYSLHAWAEVYFPGGGWRGFDPSQGLAASDRHVALAASATQEYAAPVIGALHEAEVHVTQRHEVEIRCRKM